MEVELSSQKNELFSVCVKDYGIGIDKNQLDRLFSFGFTSKTSGNGFGLHHSANAAKEMGGTLVVESEGLGKGASFILTLPICYSSNAGKT